MVAPGGGPLEQGEEELQLPDLDERLQSVGAPASCRAKIVAALEQLGASGCARAWLGGPLLWSSGTDLSYRVVWDPRDVNLNKLDSMFRSFARDFRVLRERFGGAFQPADVTHPRGEELISLFTDDDDNPRPVLRIGLRRTKP